MLQAMPQSFHLHVVHQVLMLDIESTGKEIQFLKYTVIFFFFFQQSSESSNSFKEHYVEEKLL